MTDKKTFIISELNLILERMNSETNTDKYKILFTTTTGFIKADIYLDVSVICPDIDIYDPYFYENQDLTIDMCLYKALADKTLPTIQMEDVIALRNITFYSQGTSFELPSYLLFTDSIIGICMVKKEFEVK